jgi:ribosomal-protein-alanine N-acetyltransferase
MTDHYSGKLSFIESKRIRLIAATAGLVADDLSGHEALGASLSVQVPENWPPELYDRNAMDFASSQLSDPAERGWSFWYLVDKSSQPEELLGICGFKGRPDGKGSVEIGYSVLSQYRNKGLATEAASRLVDWAFGHPHVTEVSAETLPHLRQSIRVLEKNGFSFTGQGSEQGVIRYAMHRSRLD